MFKEMMAEATSRRHAGVKIHCVPTWTTPCTETGRARTSKEFILKQEKRT